MFPIVDRFGTGYVTMDQVRQHYADPGKVQRLRLTRRSPYPPTISLICTMGTMSV
jgi:hypothetical protein